MRCGARNGGGNGMKYAVIFPGQGAQRPGMGRDIYENYTSARAVFEEADEALGFKLSNKIFNGTPEELALTEITQPAILTVSIAMCRALEEEMGACLAPCCMAGHSLGEYTSLVAAGALTLADGVRLVRERGHLMQDAVPVGTGAMAAVMGMEYGEVDSVCKEAASFGVCETSNVNSQKQIVISGETNAVNEALKIIKERYTAKTAMLRVSAPFHCVLMKPVAEKLAESFGKIKWCHPKFPIVANYNAQIVTSKEEIIQALFNQTFSPVLWLQSVFAMEKIGTEGYIELGPGSVLSGLVRKICKGKRPHAVSDKEDLLSAVAYLKGEAENG